MARWAARPVHGVLLLDKPRGLTSQQAMQRARAALRAAKAGHTGTLDPLADGLLPLCFGAATKFAQVQLDADKAYVAQLQLGQTTSTDDGEGEVLERGAVPVLDEAALRPVLDRFVGRIAQVPPLYSALKREGRPLYAYARAGQTLEVAPREVRIDAIDVVAIDGDRLTLAVRCGKGTYIRALARDIGRELGCGAHLAALRRTASGGYDVAQSIALDTLVAPDADADAAATRLLPVDSLLWALPRLDLDPAQADGLLQGRRLRLTPATPPAAGAVRVYRAGEPPIFLGVGDWDGQVLAPQRLLSDEELRSQ
jgi:tRNA pseudouridine55 synthase